MKLIHILLTLNLFSFLLCQIFIEKNNKLERAYYLRTCQLFTNGNGEIDTESYKEHVECRGKLDKEIETTPLVATCLINMNDGVLLVLSYQQGEIQDSQNFPSPTSIFEKHNVKCSRFVSKPPPYLFDSLEENVKKQILESNELIIKKDNFCPATRRLKHLKRSLTSRNKIEPKLNDLFNYIYQNWLYAHIHAFKSGITANEHELLNAHKDSFFKRVLSGILYARIGEDEKALTDYKIAAKFNKDDYGLVNLFTEINKFDEALDYLESADPKRFENRISNIKVMTGDNEVNGLGRNQIKGNVNKPGKKTAVLERTDSTILRKMRRQKRHI
jgi:hypothetical protein